MAKLYIHGHRANSIFQLLGENANDISCSVAWALAKCPAFLNAFLNSLIQINVTTKDVEIRLQQHVKKNQKRGITDIEIRAPGIFIIIEAKKGWNLPSHKQLEKYATRSDFIDSIATNKFILALSECSQEYVNATWDTHEINGLPVKSVSWAEIITLAEKTSKRGSNSEKRLLKQLLVYLEEVIRMQNINSNKVYVVALSNRKRKSWDISWIDIVEKKQCYFHPVGGGRSGWPKEPPNYIAFRYNGKLQSIHHIEEHEIFTNPHDRFGEIPDGTWKPHFLYKLGKAIKPVKEVKTGKIYPSGRVWCMLDTLLTEDTISDARDISKKRKKI